VAPTFTGKAHTAQAWHGFCIHRQCIPANGGQENQPPTQDNGVPFHSASQWIGTPLCFAAPPGGVVVGFGNFGPTHCKEQHHGTAHP